MCARFQIPKATVLGTVEFLPNIGFIRDDEAELRAMTFLVRSIQEVGALAVVVNVVPGDARFERDAKYSKCGRLKTAEEQEAMIGCVNKERMESIRQKIRVMAAQEGAPLVEMECQSTPELCGSDSFHMNQDGHERIAKQILGLMHNTTRWSSHSTDSANVMPPNTVCAHNEEIFRYMGSRSHGFFFENAASRLAPKYQLTAIVSEGVNSTLSLCLPLNLAETRRVAHVRSGKREVRGRTISNETTLVIQLGLVASHSGQGVVSVSCRGACSCEGQTRNLLRKGTRVTVEDILSLKATPSGAREECHAYFKGDMCEVILEASYDREVGSNHSLVSLRSISMHP